jgi:ubiquinone/menaquinone biosynthesis C-methylase UbiE
MSPRSKHIQEHFDHFAPELANWRKRNHYYHRDQVCYIRYLVPEGKRVLELGCGTGTLLASLQPAYGVGVDLSPETIRIARLSHPEINFLVGDAGELGHMPGEKFDYIILSDLVGYLNDIQLCLEGLHRFSAPHTRIIISSYNFLWEPVLKLAERLHLKMPAPEQSWLSLDDLRNLLYLANLQVVKTERRLLFPRFIPLFSWLLNRLGTLPLLNKVCLSQYLIARPLPRRDHHDLSSTIVIPCRNERGNIEPAIQRLPAFGRRQEVIFVDGHSTDGTQDEIRRVIQRYPAKDIKLLMQDGTGKGDAVRKGFQVAQGDILMILDADLTVPPEDLPKFYQAIASGKAEFLNGCRLIYPLEDQAMKILNLLANKFFGMAFSWLLGERLKDTLCGTKVLLREDYLTLTGCRGYFGDFDPFGDFDLLFGASKMNLKIIEIPVRYRSRAYGETKIKRFTHGLLLLRMVIHAYRKLKSI